MAGPSRIYFLNLFRHGFSRIAQDKSLRFALYSPILRISKYAAKKNNLESLFSEASAGHPQAICE
jgi:hypothetical protein